MDFNLVDLDEDHRALQQEIREYLTELFTPDVFAHEHSTGDGFNAKVYQGLGARGWLYPELPVEQGGAGFSLLQRKIMDVELDRQDARVMMMRGTSSLPMSAVRKYMPPEVGGPVLKACAKGEAVICLGYSEPDGGSDIANAKVRAVQDGDMWTINGSKMWTTGAHVSTYTFLVTRTDPDAPKHKGITMFLVPLNTPGVTIQAIRTFSGERTNIVYWSDVRIADKYRLGEVGDGARVMASALSFEHGGSGYHAAQKAMMRHAVEWARRPRNNGTVPMEDLTSRRVLAEAAVRNEVSEVLCRREVWADVEGTHSGYFGQMAKMFATEAMTISGEALQDLAAPEVLVRGRDADLDIIEVTARRGVGMTIYGGSSEVHRSVIAEKALGTPKSR